MVVPALTDNVPMYTPQSKTALDAAMMKPTNTARARMRRKAVPKARAEVLAEQLAKLERRVGHHDNSLAEIIDALRSLMERPAPTKRGIGFTAKWGTDKTPAATKATKK